MVYQAMTICAPANMMEYKAMNKSEIQYEALARARGNESASNYPAIFQGFVEKGISEDDIHPRENVFTFNAWRALGRTVKKGEHGVHILTWISCEKKNDAGEVIDTFKRPKSATVFHISQTMGL